MSYIDKLDWQFDTAIEEGLTQEQAHTGISNFMMFFLISLLKIDDIKNKLPDSKINLEKLFGDYFDDTLADDFFSVRGLDFVKKYYESGDYIGDYIDFFKLGEDRSLFSVMNIRREDLISFQQNVDRKYTNLYGENGRENIFLQEEYDELIEYLENDFDGEKNDVEIDEATYKFHLPIVGDVDIRGAYISYEFKDIASKDKRSKIELKTTYEPNQTHIDILKIFFNKLDIIKSKIFLQLQEHDSFTELKEPELRRIVVNIDDLNNYAHFYYSNKNDMKVSKLLCVKISAKIEIFDIKLLEL